MTHLFKCKECDRYTLDSETCPHCGGDVGNPHPARYSPQDKYGKYRRAAKRKNRSGLE
ncbi:MAG: RNA-protein complex protein Nop10 [Candidatus Thorarchaeota archaeon]|nr:RNA-protein complex protein Nop10 [Candidatus Thorarchaeota archaeon]